MSARILAAALSLALGARGASAGGSQASEQPPAATRREPRVFTNDDLERYRREREGATSGTAQAREGPAAPAPAGTPETPPAAGVPEDEGSGASWPARLQELRRALDAAETARDDARARVQKIESRLNPMTPDFEIDPNTILALQAELPQARAQLEQDEAEVERARAGLEAAEREARSAGLPVPRER